MALGAGQIVAGKASFVDGRAGSGEATWQETLLVFGPETIIVDEFGMLRDPQRFLRSKSMPTVRTSHSREEARRRRFGLRSGGHEANPARRTLFGFGTEERARRLGVGRRGIASQIGFKLSEQSSTGRIVFVRTKNVMCAESIAECVAGSIGGKRFSRSGDGVFGGVDGLLRGVLGSRGFRAGTAARRTGRYSSVAAAGP